MQTSPAIENAIVRGLGAYLRAASKNELPGALRPFHGKHQKMLIARRRELLDVFDSDAALRALVVQWLDGDAPLGKKDAEILRVAAERIDGWQEQLDALQPGRTPRERKPAAAVSVALEREREKARKAREEARRAREEASRSVQEAEKEKRRLADRVDVLTKRVAELEAEITRARKEVAKERGDAERAERKARRATDESSNETRRLRKEVARLQTLVDSAKTEKQPTRRKSSVTRHAQTPPEPARRRALSVPKGRFEDDPETLAEWLGADAVHLLVDGYNVSKAVGGFGDLSLADQRQRLVDELGRLARRHGVKATIVFDGSDVPPGTRRRQRSPVAVEYSRPDEIGDDHLIARLESLPRHPVVVVTNDKELQDRARAKGATIATSNQLLGLIR